MIGENLVHFGNIGGLVLGIFLVINLVIGFSYGGKIKTMRNYALANHSLGSGVLVMTLIATFVGVEDFGIRTAFDRGLIALLSPMCISIIALLFGWYVFPKLKAFKHHYTLGDIMEEMYGSYIKWPTLIITTGFSLLVILSQLITAGKFAPWLGFTPSEFIFAFGFFVTVYTCLGGVRSVAATDVLQFICLAAGVVALTSIAIINAGGLEKILGAAEQHHFQLWGHKHLGAGFSFSFLYAIWPSVLIAPPIIQRVLMTRTRTQVRHMFMGFSFFYLMMRFMLFFVGLSIWAIMKEEKETSWGASHFGFIFGNICTSIWVKISFLLAFFGVLMSTIDSYINAVAIGLVNDLRSNRWNAHNTPQKEENITKITRMVAFGVGLFCTLVAPFFIKVSLYALSSYACMLLGLLCIPFFFGILGLKGSIKVLLISWGFFFLCFGLCFFVGHTNTSLKSWVSALGDQPFRDSRSYSYFLAILSWIVSIILSTFVFLIAHHMEYGRFIWIDREKNYLKERSGYQVNRDTFRWLWAPARWANEHVAKHGKEPYLFGLFSFITFMIPYLSLGGEAGPDIVKIVGLRIIGICLVSLLLMQSLWPKLLRPYFNLYYYFTIFYCVPVVGVVTSFIDKNGHFSAMHLVLSMVWLVILVDWRTFVVMQLINIFGIMLVWKGIYGMAWPTFQGDNGLIMGLSALYTFILCMVFARKKQRDTTEQQKFFKRRLEEQKHQLLVQVDAHSQMVGALHQKSSMMQQMKASLSLLRKKQPKEEELQRLESALLHLQQVGQHSISYLPLKPEKVALDEVLQEACDGLEESKGGFKKMVESLQVEQVTFGLHAIADPFYLKQLIYNSLSYLVSRYPGKQIALGIGETRLDYHMPKEVGEQSSAPVPAIYISFAVHYPLKAAQAIYQAGEGEAPSPDPSRFKLSENARIVGAHYGCLSYVNDEQGAVHTYVLPQNVQKVRPAIVAFSDEDLFEHTHLNEPQDQAFLRAVEKKAMNRERIAEALKVAKHYHRHQKRKLGGPFYLHPLAVAELLLPYTQDENTIIAALLHDTVEDTACSLSQLEALFGKEVAQIVDEVTHIYDAGGRKMKLAKKESLKNLFKQANLKPLKIKLADRLHNMRTLEGHSSKEKRCRIAQETLDFFIPLAQSLEQPAIEKELTLLAISILKAEGQTIT